MDLEKLISLINNEFLDQLNGEEVKEGDSLFRSSRLDSLMLVRLISLLEESYDIQISPREIVPANFDTAENILNFLKIKRSMA
jgi:acyl carrier protein